MCGRNEAGTGRNADKIPEERRDRGAAGAGPEEAMMRDESLSEDIFIEKVAAQPPVDRLHSANWWYATPKIVTLFPQSEKKEETI